MLLFVYGYFRSLTYTMDSKELIRVQLENRLYYRLIKQSIEYATL